MELISAAFTCCCCSYLTDKHFRKNVLPGFFLFVLCGQILGYLPSILLPYFYAQSQMDAYNKRVSVALNLLAFLCVLPAIEIQYLWVPLAWAGALLLIQKIRFPARRGGRWKFETLYGSGDAKAMCVFAASISGLTPQFGGVFFYLLLWQVISNGFFVLTHLRCGKERSAFFPSMLFGYIILHMITGGQLSWITTT